MAVSSASRAISAATELLVIVACSYGAKTAYFLTKICDEINELPTTIADSIFVRFFFVTFTALFV